ncbi:hypothetical protein [Faecalicoccus pleomorphus]|uniref:Uncharacterized protein n=2 Tax=Faecalicoccus TaxID=1573536 RepID=A0AAW6CUR4_9FIRM|nr:hypothetical protein [Faecalicoccus pleomorphus]MDB7980401.1 hypothetical protein [Faecalicoccus pleomorphus]MDB7983161.1 hypothetical protein [Faecalicoccus pleomorphus]
MEEILDGEKNVMEYLELLFISKREYEQRKEILLKKEVESEMRRMCTFSDAVWERGKNEGILSNSIKNIQNLIQNHVVSSIEEAMDLLGVEASLRPSILQSIQIH